MGGRILRIMTIHVGLLGSDGIVIAGDRQIVENGPGNARSFTQSSKFSKNQHMVCCWAGGKPATEAAREIADVDWTSVTNREEGLRECGRKIYKAFEQGSYWGTMHKVIVGFSDGELFELSVEKLSGVMPPSDRIVIGDKYNSARLFTNLYYKKGRPVSELVFLAAHTALMASRENPAFVNGLQVAILPRNGAPYYLPQNRTEALEDLSRSLHADIASSLKQHFEI
jgi:20S proteasome alpha/beta subunit